MMKFNQLILPKILYCFTLACFPSVIFSSPTYGNPILLSQKQEQKQSQSSLENAIIRDINRARTNPLGYADLLENSLLIKSNINQQKREQVLTAIKFLRELNPLSPIDLASDLTEIATNVVNKNNQNVNNYVVISLSIKKEEQVQEIMLDLLGNNPNGITIFTPTINATGLACNPSVQKCIITYPQSNQASNTNSTTEVTKPTTEINNSTTEVTKPTTEVNNSTTEVNKPTTEVTNSTTEVTKPTTEVTKPTTEVNNPTPKNPEIAATQKYDLFERGILQDGDAVIPSDKSLYDAYTWKGKKGDILVITLESKDFDTYLAVQDPKGKIIAENDDSREGDSNSSLKVTLPADGVYRFIINSYDPKGRGNYTITVIKNQNNLK